MRSDEIKRGLARAPHRALLRALGVSDAEMERPFIGVVNAFSEVVPGHVHLRSVVDAVKAGVRSAGGVPMEFGVMGICDSANPDKGKPFDARVLGVVLQFPYLGERIGVPARVGQPCLKGTG